MRRWLIELCKSETIFIFATVLAVISCFLVPPDARYAGYIHISTICQLACLMLVVCGLQRIGVFRIVGSRLLIHAKTEFSLVLILVGLTFFSSMFITNDVALVTFIPFAISVLIMARMDSQIVLVATLMTVGANAGSMFTPIGNAHNLYLNAVSKMGTGEFLALMAPYSFLAAVMLIMIIAFVFGKRVIPELASAGGTTIEQRVLAPEATQLQPDEIRVMGYGAGHGGWRLYVYMVLFIVCILAVGGVIPLWAMVVIVAAAFMVCDRRAFFKVDWALPLTFIMFFIFIGNMKRVPEFSALAASLVSDHPLEVAAGFSQVISNVPTSILLSGFNSDWPKLIVGTNIGGMGTLIASMASLISFKNVTHKYPEVKGRYLVVYSAVNVLFLVVLLGLSLIIE